MRRSSFRKLSILQSWEWACLLKTIICLGKRFFPSQRPAPAGIEQTFLMLTPTIESRIEAPVAQSALVSPAEELTANRSAGISCDWINQWFVPWDVEVARLNFGANCGPTSFAAVLGLEVCSALTHFPGFVDRRWCNFSQMKQALRSCGVSFTVVRAALPKCGLALVQWLGPWVTTDFGGRKSLKYTHWIAVEGNWVFDHTESRWMPINAWQEEVAAVFLQDIPRATGWAVRVGIEVTKSNSRLPSGAYGLAASSSASEDSLFEYFATL